MYYEEDDQVEPRKFDAENSYLTLNVLRKSSIENDEGDMEQQNLQDNFVERECETLSKRKIGTKKTLKLVFKLLLLLFILYFFICSLDLLTSGFQLLSGKLAGKLFSQNSILRNPIAGLMLGVFVTVCVQSSSTTTAIIVSMVSAGVLKVEFAVPIIMGANVGTSVTNTIVALGQMDDREEFRRAFSGATIHDVFNWLNVIVQLPIEVGTEAKHVLQSLLNYLNSGFLAKASYEMVQNINGTTNSSNPQFLKVITDPLTKMVVQINKTVVELVAQNKSSPNDTLRKLWCGEEEIFNSTLNITEIVKKECKYLFRWLKWPDWGVGILLTILALVCLIICLVFMVKILRSLLEGHISQVLRRTIDKDFPGVFKYFTPYVFMLFGVGATILVQSSSVFTSALTPLVGSGVIGLHRMYPLTLGSNIGTTVTAILSAFSSGTVESLRNSLQAALCHLLFNLFGVAIWFIIPITRHVPIQAAKFLGRTTAKYRWFALLYLFVMFILFPLLLFGLSFAGIVYSAVALVIIVVFVLVIVALNMTMKYRPKWLPSWLKNWNFLPEPLRSLAPYDRFLARMKLASGSWIRSHIIRPESSITSMTKLFRNETSNSISRVESI